MPALRRLALARTLLDLRPEGNPMSTFGYPAGDKSASELGAPPEWATQPTPTTALTEAQFRELLQARLSEPTLDPIRAHALLCAATYLAPMRRAGPSEVVETAREFEAYLRGGD